MAEASEKVGRCVRYAQQAERRDRPDQALAALALAMSLAPEDPDLRMLQSDLCSRQGRPSEALEHCRQALRLAPDRLDVRLKLHALLEASGRGVEAGACLDAARRAAPKDARVWFALGERNCRGGRWAEAVRSLERALALGQRGPEAHLMLAAALEARSRPREAEAHLRRALRLAGAQAQAWAKLGEFLFRRGRRAEAGRAFRQALRRGPLDADARLRFAEILEGGGRPRAAEAQLSAALAVEPGNAQAWLRRGRLALSLGERARAEQHLARAVELGAPGTEALMLLASLRQEDGQARQARELLTRVLAVDPGHGEARLLLARLRAAGGRGRGRGCERRFGDLEAGARVGRFNRLKEHFPFDLFLKGRIPASPEHLLYAAAGDREALGIDLCGMKVLLARGPCLPPCETAARFSMPPLSTLVLANVLSAQGAKVEIRDLYLCRRRWPRQWAAALDEPVPREQWRRHLDGRPSRGLAGLLDRLVRELTGRGADAVALSVESPGDMLLAPSLARELGRGGLPVVVGGREARLDEPLLDQCPEVKLIGGEGELPLLCWLDAVQGRRPLSQVPGLNWTEEGARRSCPAVLHDLDLRPRFDLSPVALKDYDHDILPEGSGPMSPYQFNVGCPFFCGFCNGFTRRAYRLRSPENIVADLAAAAREHGVRRFYFINHLLNCDPRHFAELVDRLEAARLGLLWADGCRPAGLDLAMLKRLRRIGACQLVWGVDCPSRRVARLMRKCSDAEQAARIIAQAHQAGIRSIVNVIVGMPHENDQDVEETIRFIAKVKPYVLRFNLAPYGYFPTSALGRAPQAFGLRRGAAGGVDEPGGLRWAERQAMIPKWIERIQEAAQGKVRLEPEDPAQTRYSCYTGAAQP